MPDVLQALLEPIVDRVNGGLLSFQAQPVILTLRILYLVGGFILCLRIWGSSTPKQKTRGHVARSQTLLQGLSWLGLALILVLVLRQAHWQLFGRRNAEFVAFMQKYDRREFNPVHSMRAGRLLDHTGTVTLAESREWKGEITRFYLLGPQAAHAVGYNHTKFGMAGMEAAMRSTLLGIGQERGGLDSWRRDLLRGEKADAGPDVRTTLDATLQQEAARLLMGKKGAVVVLDVGTGRVRVLCSMPAFGPNRLTSASFAQSGSDAPFLNRAIQGQYPPGSVFKLPVAMASLEMGFDGRFSCPPGGYTTSQANPPIRDHEFYEFQKAGRHWSGHGDLDLAQALTVSSNVFFAQLGVWMGGEILQDTIGALEMNRRIPLTDPEVPDLVITPAKTEREVETNPYHIAQQSIGQGRVLVSPMHMAMVCASIARGGEVVLPRLQEDQPVEVGARVMGQVNAMRLRRMMEQVVQSGTGRGAQISGVRVAGKTGTAELGGGRDAHSWFVGFAPADNPKLAFAVLVENGGYGSKSAVPIARRLLELALQEGKL